MSRFTFLVAIACLSQCQLASGQLRWSIEEDGTVYVESTELTPVSGFDFQSSGGHLRVGDTSSPFSFFMAAAPDRVIFAKLSSEVWIDGSLSLDLKVDRAFIDDVNASWDSLSTSPELMPLISGAPASTPMLRATFPSGGGPITIEPVDGQLELSHVQFFADHGSTSLFSIGDDPSPFARFSPNTSRRENLNFVTLNASNSVSLDGPVTLDVFVPPGTNPLDLRATWHRSHLKVGTVEFVPEPHSILLAAWLILATAARRISRR